MPVSRRLELLEYASQRESLIIEDDYENEFVYLQKPTPSLFGLSGGQNASIYWLFFQTSPSFHPDQLYGPSPIFVGCLPKKS